LKNARRRNANAGFNTSVTTGHAVLCDGAVIELVATSSGSKPDLLLWNGTDATVASRIEYKGRTYEAPEVHPSILGTMRLPTGCAHYTSTRKLFMRIAGLFTQYFDLPDQDASLLAYFALSTHFADFLQSAPGLLISGPDVYRAIGLLRLLRSVCRRPLMLAEITAGGFRSLPMYLHPTLLINQSGLTPSMAALLHTSRHRGLNVPGSRGSVLDLYGARAIFMGMDAGNNLACGDLIRISQAPAQPHSPVLGDVCLDQIARELQPQLLMYRLVNWRKVQDSNFDVLTFTFPMRELARNLGACVVDDLELAQRVSLLLDAQDEDVRTQRCTDIRYVMIEVILILLHKRELSAVRVEKMADLTNVLLRSRGEIVEYSAEEVGWKLRHLGLCRHRDGTGKSLSLNSDTSRRVHEWARSWGVLSRQNALDECPDCAPPTQSIVLA
jgi:hypothetical protein